MIAFKLHFHFRKQKKIVERLKTLNVQAHYEGPYLTHL